jgi:hypothetical protein
MRKVWCFARFALLTGLAASLASPPLEAQRKKEKKDDADRRVVVANGRSSDMMRLYASRVTTSDWEENILSRPIPAGASIVVNFDDGTGACEFDFRAVFRDHQMVQRWKINVCVESEWHVVD